MSILTGLIPNQGEIQYPFGPPPDGEDIMWRCEAKSYSVVLDYETERYGSSDPVLEMLWFRVTRRTPSGARLDNGRFVYTDKRITRREWASNTPAEALESFRARRRRQIGILSHQLRRAEMELALTEGVELE